MLAKVIVAVLAIVASAGIGQAQPQQDAARSWSDTRSGQSVFELQVLLDRARFSPGIVDGMWGQNTANALYHLMRREGFVDKTATPTEIAVDDRMYARLRTLAGDPGDIVRKHTLSEQDVSGPFVTIPDDIYAQAKMDCLCYTSLPEKLAELFHTSPEVLGRLNPNVTLDSLKAGDTITVPNVTKMVTGPSDTIKTDSAIARIEISDESHYVQALDKNGRVLYHFPSTLGSEFNPSPEGEFSVNAIAFDPSWHYQPDLLGDTDNTKNAMIPHGANNPVGLVWMDLSKPHYGIHGTSAPETIGYAVSHGCIRLTNWDALFLAHRIDKGLAVHFVDVSQ